MVDGINTSIVILHCNYVQSWTIEQQRKFTVCTHL